MLSAEVGRLNADHLLSEELEKLLRRVLRYFRRVFVATFFSIVQEIDSIFLFVTSCQKLFAAGCQTTPFGPKKFH